MNDPLKPVIDALTAERDKINKALAALGPVAVPDWRIGQKKSAAVRAKMSRSQKARWRKLKKAA